MKSKNDIDFGFLKYGAIKNPPKISNHENNKVVWNVQKVEPLQRDQIIDLSPRLRNPSDQSPNNSSNSNSQNLAFGTFHTAND